MLMFWMFHCLLLAWTCLYVCGAPVQEPNFFKNGSEISLEPTQNTTSESPDKDHASSFLLNVDTEGGIGPHEGPEGIDSVTQMENGDRRFGLSKSSGEAWSQRSEVEKTKSKSEMRKSENEKDTSVEYEVLSLTGGNEQTDTDSTSRWMAEISLSSTFSPSQTDEPHTEGRVDETKPFDVYLKQGEIQETSLQSSTEPVQTSLWTQKLPPRSAFPPISFINPRTFAPPTIWSNNGATTSSLRDLVLPEMEPNLMPRDDGLESLWTEATKLAEGDTAVPLAQDEATEATMSSEALPLIFEPFEDGTVEGAADVHVTGSAQTPGATATKEMPPSGVDSDQLATEETDSDGPSPDPSVLPPDWTSPWQTSGAELPEPVGASGPSVSQRQVEAEPGERPEKGITRTSIFRESMPSTVSSFTTLQYALKTVTMATHQPRHKSRSGLEEMESDEEDDENSEESLEEESEEDLTEAPKACSTQPTYSLIPPPPVWVQRNQGLMRSWVELIREKAGYVSGMLAPVGIGITGALLIVGALYSIRMIYRKRRNSFKHQRRKARQPEVSGMITQPCEPSTSRQDQAMLLADSSEDEF